ncbi:Serine/threonine phosphatase PPP [Minicystis rosea]|nr:Serine/threonine phosphatase PPP [Minicystis rosea]
MIEEERGRIVVSVAALTHASRNRNEDSFGIGTLDGAFLHAPSEACPTGEHCAAFTLTHGLVLGVYDGAGGHAAGEVASKDAAHLVQSELAHDPSPTDEDDLRARLEQALGHANRTLLERSMADARRRGSISTATVAALAGACAIIAQTGDSRAYLLRNRRLVQLTRDDRLVAEMVRQGLPNITAEELDALPSQILTKALGIRADLEPSLSRVLLQRDDVLLLCSDGLWGIVGAQTIRSILLRQRAPSIACRVLFDEAMRAGGRDDVTIIVARFSGDGLESPIQTEIGG